jgi:hypothetical protein
LIRVEVYQQLASVAHGRQSHLLSRPRLGQFAGKGRLRVAYLDPHDVDEVGHEDPDAVRSLSVEFNPKQKPKGGFSMF